MNLDFLDVLSQPAQQNVGTLGTSGTSRSDAGLRVPNGVPGIGNDGNKAAFSVDVTQHCSPAFPSRSQASGTGKPGIYAAVPIVPAVPNLKDQVSAELDSRAAEVQVAGWIVARCTRPHDPRKVWGSEKSLYGDCVAWCEQRGQTPCSREQFCGILDVLFQREMDGWQGLCLAVDWTASKGSGVKSHHGLMVVERAQSKFTGRS